MNSKYEQGYNENAQFPGFAPPPPVKQVVHTQLVGDYNQGWRKAREQLKTRQRSLWSRLVKWFKGTRTKAEVKKDLGTGLCLLALAHITLFTLLAIFGTGCASLQMPSAGQATAQARDHYTLKGVVKVAQMGLDCEKQEELLKRILSDVFVEQGLPAPDKIELQPLSGSSLCGIAQGMGDELGTPELGARNTAKAEVMLYWSAIFESELNLAAKLLASLSPL